MMPVYQNQPFTFVFKMVDSLGARLTGLLNTDININVSAPGSGSFAQISIVDFTEIGFGYYSVTIPVTITANLGEVIAIAQGAGAVDFDKMYAVVPSPVTSTEEVDLCEIFGNIVDLTGSPVRGNTPIVVRGNSGPIQVGNSLLSVNKIMTNTDASGNFSVKLLRGQSVNFQIEGVGIKNISITVPNQASANLKDLIPS